MKDVKDMVQGRSGGSAKCQECPDLPSGQVRSHSGDVVLKRKKSRVSGLSIFGSPDFLRGGVPPIYGSRYAQQPLANTC